MTWKETIFFCSTTTSKRDSGKQQMQLMTFLIFLIVRQCKDIQTTSLYE